jgi:hypothetical protein
MSLPKRGEVTEKWRKLPEELGKFFPEVGLQIGLVAAA